MQTRISFACVVALSLGACVVEEDPAFEETEQQVQGGLDEPEHRYPWVVQVNSPAMTCHGVLIHPSWVLTAAHCIPASPGVPWAEYSRTDPYTGVVHSGMRYAAYNPTRRIYIHPDYEGGFSHDLALFKLETPFVLDRYIQTVALPTSAPMLGQVGTIASYIHHDGPGPAGNLAIFRGAIWDGQYCGSSFDEFCVQNDDAEACPGDSGSGFVRNVGSSLSSNGRATVLGIASNSIVNDCTEDDLGLPVTMMNVYGARNWISEILGISLGDLAGDSRLRWNGQPSNGLMTLRCERSPSGVITKTAAGPMNAAGAELRLDCGPLGRARATCTLYPGASARIDGFKVTTTNTSTGAVTTTNLPYQPTSATSVTSYSFSGAVIRDFQCSVAPVAVP